MILVETSRDCSKKYVFCFLGNVFVYAKTMFNMQKRQNTQKRFRACEMHPNACKMPQETPPYLRHALSFMQNATKKHPCVQDAPKCMQKTAKTPPGVPHPSKIFQNAGINGSVPSTGTQNACKMPQERIRACKNYPNASKLHPMELYAVVFKQNACAAHKTCLFKGLARPAHLKFN